MEDAKKSIRNITQKDWLTEERLDAQIALISHTIEMEAAETAGSGWKELFTGTNRRRTEIVRKAMGVNQHAHESAASFGVASIGADSRSRISLLNCGLLVEVELMIVCGTLACPRREHSI